jgi:hypothetical protein
MPDPDFAQLEMSDSSLLPLPVETYPRQRGEWGLLNIEETAMDRVLEKQCLKFAKLEKSQRQSVVDSLAKETRSALHQFISRSAVFSLRSKDPNRVKAAWVALSMIDQSIGPRETIVGGSYVLAAAKELDMSKEWFNESATTLFRPNDFISNVNLQLIDNEHVAFGFGQVQVDTELGPGLVSVGKGNRTKSEQLLSTAMQVAEGIENDPNYRVQNLTVASDRLPSYWLDAPMPANAKVNAAIRIVARINAEIAKHQVFDVHVYELATVQAATDLQSLVDQQAAAGKPVFASSRKNIICIGGTRCYLKDGVCHETNESLERFQPWLEQALAQ